MASQTVNNRDDQSDRIKIISCTLENQMTCGMNKDYILYLTRDDQMTCRMNKDYVLPQKDGST